MDISSVRRGGAVFAALLAFAGCSSISTSLTPATAAAPASRQSGSWMAKGLTNVALLYVTNIDGLVNVYDYSTHKLVGVLTAFAWPMGECADKNGNVYILDYSNKTIYEYAHGGTKPIHTISDSYWPSDCAIDPKTGNLAITNYGNQNDGNVAIYVHAKGQPIYYGTGSDFNACGYDKYGDLLAAGYSGSQAKFYYLTAHSKNFGEISLPGPKSSWSWSNIYAILWDGKYFDVDPGFRYTSGTSAIYRYTINIKGVYHDEIPLSGNGVLGPVALYSSTLKAKPTQIVGTSRGASNTGYLTYWKYPAGGSPIYQTSKYLDDPYGIVVSPAS
ncbi:MAG TPA: hypothetical protein VGI19_01610 [Candidatus Cybelea sp.]|jgi:hypothetical protein